MFNSVQRSPLPLGRPPEFVTHGNAAPHPCSFGIISTRSDRFLRAIDGVQIFRSLDRYRSRAPAHIEGKIRCKRKLHEEDPPGGETQLSVPETSTPVATNGGTKP